MFAIVELPPKLSAAADSDTACGVDSEAVGVAGEPWGMMVFSKLSSANQMLALLH
jgi:hypothetical protein